MSIVDLLDEIREGQLELMSPQSTSFVLRCEVMTRTEKQENIRGLTDQKIAGFQKWRGERRTVNPVAIENSHERRNAGAFFFRSSRDIEVFGTGFLKGQADELSAALDGRPVVEFIGHERDSVRSAPAGERLRS